MLFFHAITLLSTLTGVLASVSDIVPDVSIDMSSYHDNAALVAQLRAFEDQYPDLAKVYEMGTSVLGTKIYAIRITDQVNTRELGEPKFKYVGNIHGNEPVGRELLLYLADYLLSHYNTSARVQELVDSTDIYLMPTMNPDGFADSFEGDCNSTIGRFNANGVDLNRDFPDRLDIVPKNQFAPETRMIMDWLAQDPNFVLSGSLHGGTLVANYPYDNDVFVFPFDVMAPTPDDDVFIDLAKEYSFYHGNMTQYWPCGVFEPFVNGIINGAYWYHVSGGMQDYNYEVGKCFEVTLEISCCKYPLASHLPLLWTHNKESLLAFMEKTQWGIKGLVLDHQSRPIAGATVKVDGRSSTSKTSAQGEYWRILLQGIYNITVTARGHPHSKNTPGPHEVTVTAQRFKAETKTLRVIDCITTIANFTLIPSPNDFLMDTINENRQSRQRVNPRVTIGDLILSN